MRYLFILIFLSQCLSGSAQNLHTRNKDLPCINKHFNIFAHVVYDSTYTTRSIEKIENGLAQASKFFAPICLSFSLCETDTVFNFNYNTLTPNEELNEISTLYGDNRRINMYFISDTLISVGISGLCVGNVGSISDANIYIKGIGSITHELGHFFGLAHTFAGFEELVDGSNCDTVADAICDTPADPFIAGEDLNNYIKDCTFIYEIKDPNNQYYQPDVGNIMSYYNCDCGFTRGQYLKMAKNYFAASKKHW